MRSSVDLPQPELPSSAKSSFLAMFRLTLSTAMLSPNFLTTFSIRTNASFFAGVALARRASGALTLDVEFMI
ncbi:hypothetical protein LMG27952_03635 [Paraburkholderia hiiakae]|uniref:Uncharacterized protein n=1 Tax=Paraburkholderia hiiakae TaxID=1081782 RepID=A0ABN7I0N8_9BURK|nr:hypothetical protein LMG27952_03635 [Paraburkholderia hiiakae]